jgi:cell division protein FtsA
MDTRIGYPNEHLAGDSDSETTSPMFATAVGLVLDSLNSRDHSAQMKVVVESEANASGETIVHENDDDEIVDNTPKERKRFFDKWAEKFKEFLDNAE